MSFILRSIDISATPIKITEYFLEYLKVDDTSGKGLFEVIMNEIENIGLDIDNLRGQGYDNGSNMKESFRVDYFLYIVDQAILSLQNRFEQFEAYELPVTVASAEKKFFKIKIDKILSKINYVSREIKWISHFIN
ncbi:PREDICTED: zinc finger MYM-type protein 1-like [Nicotiana attenuata]|uniref:zinc finger MYM-type protein 1-like n=1 Tax=Nicotiana attenuata TaxID=49451 RepID=UPI000905A5DA|nr:PREDICTED: zinc finger MYM-type protein 1-like [Nicotiana attenuata]